MSREVLFKVIIIGDGTVGKTAFVKRYVNDIFKRDDKGTIGVDFALKILNWSEKLVVKLQLWDIAGQERYTSMMHVYYKDSYGCIIMFDLTNRKSFENALRWKQDVEAKCAFPDGKPLPCILLANKCDLSEDREVSHDEIEAFSKEHDFTAWCEVSAKDDVMVTESVKYLVEEMLSIHAESDTTDQESSETVRPRLKLQDRSKAPNSDNKCSC